MTFLARCGKTRSACLDMLAGARGKLATGRLATAERAAHFGEVDTEHVMQQEACALEWREAFQHQHQRDGNVMGETARGVVVVEGFVDHWLGQPLTDIGFAARLCRLHSVEAEPRHYRADIAAR